MNKKDISDIFGTLLICSVLFFSFFALLPFGLVMLGQGNLKLLSYGFGLMLLISPIVLIYNSTRVEKNSFKNTKNTKNIKSNTVSLIEYNDNKIKIYRENLKTWIIIFIISAVVSLLKSFSVDLFPSLNNLIILTLTMFSVVMVVVYYLKSLEYKSKKDD